MLVGRSEGDEFGSQHRGVLDGSNVSLIDGPADGREGKFENLAVATKTKSHLIASNTSTTSTLAEFLSPCPGRADGRAWGPLLNPAKEATPEIHSF